MSPLDDIPDYNESPLIPRTHCASRYKRLENFLIDFFLNFLIFMGIIMVGDGLDGLFNTKGIADIFIAIGLLFYLIGYYVIFEYKLGKTPGKYLTGTSVVNLKGESPSLGQVLGRTFCRYIPFEPFSFLIGYEVGGWHDRIPKTLVVDDAAMSQQ